MSTQILISDLCPLFHNGSKLEVCERKTKTGYQGMVKVTLPTGPNDVYKVPCNRKDHPHETDACADAINMRRVMIEMNSVGPRK